MSSVLVLLLLICPINLITRWANYYDVDPVLAIEIARMESAFAPTCIGDDGAAVGIYQWHIPSWEYVRRMAGWDISDQRADSTESVRTAMYAIGTLHLEHWWTAYRILERRGHVYTTESERPAMEKPAARNTPDFHNR